MIELRADKFISQQSTMRKYETAPKANVEEIAQWHRSYRGEAIDRDEQAYLETGEDLVCVVQKERDKDRDQPVLHRLVDEWWPQKLEFWKDKKRKGRQGDINGSGNSNHPGLGKQTDVFLSFVIMAIGAVMLMAPVWILRAVDSTTTKLGVVTAFLGVLLAILSVLLVQKPLQALGAAAA